MNSLMNLFSTAVGCAVAPFALMFFLFLFFFLLSLVAPGLVGAIDQALARGLP